MACFTLVIHFESQHGCNLSSLWPNIFQEYCSDEWYTKFDNLINLKYSMIIYCTTQIWLIYCTGMVLNFNAIKKKFPMYLLLFYFTFYLSNSWFSKDAHTWPSSTDTLPAKLMWQSLRVWAKLQTHSLPMPTAGTPTSLPLVQPNPSFLVPRQLHHPRWRWRRKMMMRWTCLVHQMMRRRYATFILFLWFTTNCVWCCWNW